MTRTDYETAVARFRAVEGGEITQDDYFIPDKPPYRLASVRVVCQMPAVAGIAGFLATMTAETGAHMIMFCVSDAVFWFDVMASRDLDESEIGDAPAGTRAVA